jgi:hypothetical protein
MNLSGMLLHPRLPNSMSRHLSILIQPQQPPENLHQLNQKPTQAWIHLQLPLPPELRWRVLLLWLLVSRNTNRTILAL